jgi:hypothetical protein
MARIEADREDIWGEARALSPRIELQIPCLEGPVVAGFREVQQGWSFYFGQDPVYHFDEAGRLRRAYRSGELFRTQGATLARLVRVRTEAESTLSRHDLTAEELAEFLEEMRAALQQVSRALADGTAVVIREEPFGAGAAIECQAALRRIEAVTPPLAPAFPTRRT